MWGTCLSPEFFIQKSVQRKIFKYLILMRDWGNFSPFRRVFRLKMMVKEELPNFSHPLRYASFQPSDGGPKKTTNFPSSQIDRIKKRILKMRRMKQIILKCCLANQWDDYRTNRTSVIIFGSSFICVQTG